jgi:hypothetical protein
LLGRKIDESTIVSCQSAVVTEREGNQVRVGDLGRASQPLPGDGLVVGDLDVVGPEGVAGQGGDPA